MVQLETTIGVKWVNFDTPKWGWRFVFKNVNIHEMYRKNPVNIVKYLKRKEDKDIKADIQDGEFFKLVREGRISFSSHTKLAVVLQEWVDMEGGYCYSILKVKEVIN